LSSDFNIHKGVPSPQLSRERSQFSSRAASHSLPFMTP
jgi:hypothetical protein